MAEIYIRLVFSGAILCDNTIKHPERNMYMKKHISALALALAFSAAACAGCSPGASPTDAPTASGEPTATTAGPDTSATATATALPDVTPPINPSYDLGNEKMAPKTLPEFSTLGLDGNTYTRDILQGSRLTMVYYWATYCPYCKEELPYIAEIGNSMPEGSRMVSVVMDISGDAAEQTATATQLAEEHGIAFPLLKMDEAGVLEQHAFDETTGKPFIKPTTVFYDENGAQVGDILIGSFSKEEYASALEERLAML